MIHSKNISHHRDTATVANAGIIQFNLFKATNIKLAIKIRLMVPVLMWRQLNSVKSEVNGLIKTKIKPF